MSMKQANHLPNTYLYESIKNFDRLSQCVQQYLRIDAKQFKLFVVARQQVVTVVVESAILANQLRYQQQEVLKHINHTFLSQFKEVKIKLVPPQMTPVVEAKPRKELSKEVSAILMSMAEGFDDEELKASLQRIATPQAR